jgi:hypothetical protein
MLGLLPNVYSPKEEFITNVRGVLVPLVFISLHLVASAFAATACGDCVWLLVTKILSLRLTQKPNG